jgi:hypothetical protein
MNEQRLASREDRLKTAMAEWLATPSDLREHQDLAQLAQALGLRDSAELLALGAGNAEWNQQMLQATATLVLSEMPGVLSTLVTAAKAGSVRATEVLLDWLRKTIQNHPSQAAGMGNTNTNVHQTLVLLSEGAGDLAGLVAALGETPEDAGSRMEAWRSQQALNARARATTILERGIPAGVVAVGETVDEESPFPSKPASSVVEVGVKMPEE